MSLIGIICIVKVTTSKDCHNIIDIYNDIYNFNNLTMKINFSEILLLGNRILSDLFIEKRMSVFNLDKYIGTSEYNRLFNSNFKYYQLRKNIKAHKILLNVDAIEKPFTEGLLQLSYTLKAITYNSTSILTEPVFLLNKRVDPFINIISEEDKDLTTFQENFYSLVINCRYYEKK